MADELLLSPYRVLDLTDERGLLCGKILADLGADVIHVEPPAGSPARSLAPFYKDIPHPERSLFWWAYCANKRSVTLNIETPDGKGLLKRLVASAHFLIESFEPGYMASLGLGFEELKAENTAIVMVSVSPFGQEGPYAHYKAPDIVGMALGGLMYLTGDPDRPPVRVTFPQAYLHGASSGAVGAMIAHYHRQITGQGQYVDVSAQQAAARALAHAPQIWDLNRYNLKRQGSFRAFGEERLSRVNWPCKDGYVNFIIGAGPVGGRSMRGLVEWMNSEGMADEYVKEVDWEKLEAPALNQELIDRASKPVAGFFMTHTKSELWEEAIKRRILLFPVSTPKDILENAQLEARGFFEKVKHPELDVEVTYPGMFVQASGIPLSIRCRAPLIGEHNQEVYCGELGLSKEELVNLYSVGVV